jgi:hypothetical protein
MRRVLAGLLAACAVLLPVLPAGADPLDKAKAAQRSLQRELDAATLALVRLENDQFWAEQDLVVMRRRLPQARAELAAAQRVLGERAASIYRTGSASLLSSLLGSDAAQVAERAELVTMLTARQADLVAEAETAADSYTQAVRQVARAQARSKDLRQRRKATVAASSSGWRRPRGWWRSCRGSRRPPWSAAGWWPARCRGRTPTSTPGGLRALVGAATRAPTS